MKKYFPFLFLVLLLLGCTSSLQYQKLKYKVIKCKNGEKVALPKYDPFAFYEISRTSTLKFLLKITNNKSLELPVEDSLKISSLVEKFDQITSSSLISAKLQFEVFKLNACNKELQTKYLKTLEEFIVNDQEIQSLRLKIDAIISKGGLSGSNTENIIFQLKRFTEKKD